MRHSLQDYRGAVSLCLRDPDAIQEAALDYHINLGASELFLKIISEWNRRTQQRATVDLILGQDVVELPEACSDLTHVWRLDVQPGEPYPVRKIDTPLDFQLVTDAPNLNMSVLAGYRGPRFAYVPMPLDRIRLIPGPDTTLADGLLLEFYPRFVQLRVSKDVPMLPEEIHPAVVSLALLSLKAQADASFKDPGQVMSNANRWEQRVTDWLTPDSRADARQILDESDYF